METARVRFLETRIVDDVNKGTVRETRFEAGETYELDVRSADRWVKRGAARFLSDDDERKAGGASSDVALSLTDKIRKDDPASPGGNPGQVPSRNGGSADAERIAITDRIAGLVVAQKIGLESDAWSKLSASQQLEHLRAADGELAAYLAGQPVGGPDDGDDRARGALPPGTEGVSDGGSDTDGDQLGDNVGPGAGETAKAPDFEAMSDEELREFIDKRDGKRPRVNTSRETLLAKARGAED